MKNFLGLTKKYSAIENASVIILPVSFDKTTSYIHGSDKGPKAIIEASQNLELYDIDTDSEVYKKGIHTTAPIIENTSTKMLKRLFFNVKKFLKQKKFIVTLGGEHSISFAPINAHAQHLKKPFSVLHFDAHSDLRPSYENNPYSHASVMYRVKKIPNIKNIISIGIRSSSIEEKKYLNKKTTFFAHDIHTSNIWMKKANDLLLDNVYITFDVDVFDSSLMPSTGTPEPGGLFWHQVDNFLKFISSKKTIIGFDVVELCPIKNFIAPDFLVAKLIYKILSYALKNR